MTADVDVKQIAAGDIIADLERDFLPLILADYPGMTYSLEGEQEEQAESFGGLINNYLVALFVIYALLAIPLRSYVQPLIIMAVIPFGLVGAIVGHWFMFFAREIFTDQSFNFSMMSVFGFVALTGRGRQLEPRARPLHQRAARGAASRSRKRCAAPASRASGRSC